MSSQGTRLTNQELTDWQSGDAAHRIAAKLGVNIQTEKVEPWASLPSNAELGSRYDVSPSTASRAKALLTGRGLIRREGRYHVVTGPPR